MMNLEEKSGLVILVEDDDILRDTLTGFLDKAGFDCLSTRDLPTARRLIGETLPDLVLCDINLPSGSGLDLLDDVMALNNSIAIIFITGYATVDGAVEALKRGAYDYIEKPFSLPRLLHKVKRAVEWVQMKRTLTKGGGDDDFKGISPAARHIRKLIGNIAPTDTTVLITGETGTGKEVAARMIHRLSSRAGGPFVKLNCGAIPEGLIESELFGHERGAFTGAVTRRKGRFEASHHGTLLLDEIGEMPLPGQVHLLGVIQDGEITRVGGEKAISIDTRLIAATNKDLAAACAEGSFRSDLYFRINVFPIEIPPLRSRREDIAPIALHLIRRISARMGIIPPEIDANALDELTRRDWPGNVRQLDNILERIIITKRSGLILSDDIPPDNPQQGPEARRDLIEVGMTLRDAEKVLIERTLAASSSRKEAARILGLNYRTFLDHLKRLGIRA